MKILFLAANPESTSRLNLEKEAREIQEALDSSELSQEFELIQRWEVRPKDFRRALLRYKPDIVHFSGHGRGKSGLVISDDGGKSKAVMGDALAGLFAAFPMVKCVLLNACYAEVQAKAIVRHVDYVIGMKDTIDDKAAIAFSIGFYDSLGYGINIETAFDLGKNAILWEYKYESGETRQMIPVEPTEANENLPEHLTPVLLKKVSVITSETKRQSLTSPPVVKIDAKQLFCDRVQKYLDERKLTPIARFQLGNLAKEQGISESEANGILEAGLQKIEENKKTYRKLLQETIAAKLNPFDSSNQQELKGLQQDLKLTDGEVATILEATRAKNEIEQVKEDKSINDKLQPKRIIDLLHESSDR